MKRKIALLCVWFLSTTSVAFAVEQRAVVTNRQHLYRKADLESKTMGRLTVGEEVTVRASKGVLLQVAAPGRQPGWTLANGLVVLDNNPKAPGLLFQAAEVLAEGDSPKDWIRASRLFRNAASLVLDGPYAPEARWRAAELSWRIVVRTAGVIAPSSGAVAELEGVVRSYPKTRAAAEAAFLLLRTNLCDYWDGTPGCPEAEIGLLARYLEEYPDSERTSELRYALAYRHAALVEIYLQQDKSHFSAEKAVEHKQKARQVVEALLHPKAARFDASWAARAERLLWSLDNNIGVFSDIEVALNKF